MLLVWLACRPRVSINYMVLRRNCLSYITNSVGLYLLNYYASFLVLWFLAMRLSRMLVSILITCFAVKKTICLNIGRFLFFPLNMAHLVYESNWTRTRLRNSCFGFSWLFLIVPHRYTNLTALFICIQMHRAELGEAFCIQELLTQVCFLLIFKIYISLLKSCLLFVWLFLCMRKNYEISAWFYLWITCLAFLCYKNWLPPLVFAIVKFWLYFYCFKNGVFFLMLNGSRRLIILRICLVAHCFRMFINSLLGLRIWLCNSSALLCIYLLAHKFWPPVLAVLCLILTLWATPFCSVGNSIDFLFFHPCWMFGFVRSLLKFSPFLSVVFYSFFLPGFQNLTCVPFCRLLLASAGCGSAYATGPFVNSSASIRTSC